ncbi:MAG: tetratricopeptide repeat protein [Archangium sp.]|nr:tetratricopeptide repeat protein [Archangium sp.]
MTRWLVTVPLILFVGCFGIPPPTQRALECNELCAQYLSAGDLERAEVQCDLGLQFSPQYADLYVNKGLIALRRNQLSAAKELFIKALRYNQEQAQAYNNLGFIYLQEQAFGKAHDNFQRALRVNPDYLEARFNLALAFIGLKQPDKAHKELRTLLEINPNLADAHAQLGNLAFDEKDYDTAIAEYSRAVELSPSFVDAWLQQGNAYMEAGKPCDGKESYASCIETDANKAECRNNIIIAEKKCKLQDKALEELKQRQAGATTAESEYSAALKYRDQGLVNDEERAYKKCLKHDGKYALCHFGLFELFKGRSDDKNATTACTNFLKFATQADFPTQVATCRTFVRD